MAGFSSIQLVSRCELYDLSDVIHYAPDFSLSQLYLQNVIEEVQCQCNNDSSGAGAAGGGLCRDATQAQAQPDVEELEFYTRATIDEITKGLCTQNAQVGVQAQESKVSRNSSEQRGAELEQMKRNEDALRAEVEDAKQQCCADLAKMRLELEAANNVIECLKAEKSKYQGQLDKNVYGEEMCAEAMRKLKELQEQNAQRQKQIECTESERDALISKLRQCEAKFECLCSKMSSLEQCLEQNSKETAIVGKDLEDSINLVKQISDVQIKNQELTNAVKALNGQNEKKLIEDTKQQLAKEQEECKRAKDELNELQKQIEDLKKKNQCCEDAKKELCARVQKAMEDMQKKLIEEQEKNKQLVADGKVMRDDLNNQGVNVDKLITDAPAVESAKDKGTASKDVRSVIDQGAAGGGTQDGAARKSTESGARGGTDGGASGGTEGGASGGTEGGASGGTGGATEARASRSGPEGGAGGGGFDDGIAEDGAAGGTGARASRRGSEGGAGGGTGGGTEARASRSGPEGGAGGGGFDDGIAEDGAAGGTGARASLGVTEGGAGRGGVDDGIAEDGTAGGTGARASRRGTEGGAAGSGIDGDSATDGGASRKGIESGGGASRKGTGGGARGSAAGGRSAQSRGKGPASSSAGGSGPSTSKGDPCTAYSKPFTNKSLADSSHANCKQYDNFITRAASNFTIKTGIDDLEREIREILDAFIEEYGYCCCRCYVPRSKFYSICHHMCHHGIQALSFKELAYIHKKIYLVAEKIYPGCLLNMILAERKNEPDRLKCCTCKKTLCCSNSDEMLKDKVNKLEHEIEKAKEYLDSLVESRRTSPRDCYDCDDGGENKLDGHATYRAVRPTQPLQACTSKQLRKLKAQLYKRSDRLH